MEHLDSGWIVDEDSDECEVLDVDPPGLGIAETDVCSLCLSERES